MVLSALPEHIRQRYNQILDLEELKQELWGEYGTQQALSKGINSVFKKINRTQNVKKFLEFGVGELQKI